MKVRTCVSVAAAGSVVLSTCLTGCVIGPISVAAGRGVYNEVVNRTEDEQLLNVIVHDRYNETAGMMAVASVTANIKATAAVTGQWGLTRSLREDYAGNLVPLGGAVAYEENPTISYVPLGGEQFMERILSPIGMEELVLIGQVVPGAFGTYLGSTIRSINGLENARLTRDGEGSPDFDRLVNGWEQLRAAGCARVGRVPEGGFAVFFRTEDAEDERILEEILTLAKINKRPSGGKIVVPIRLGLEGWEEDAFNLDTLSVIETLRLAGACIDVPPSHLQSGAARSVPDRQEGRFMHIRTSRWRPGGEGTVAIRYRGWWYYVDDTDADSKMAFVYLRVLVGLRLYERGAAAAAPVLTIPVG